MEQTSYRFQQLFVLSDGQLLASDQIQSLP
jgi:hypothetical protein